jgi:hypothetical protein
MASEILTTITLTSLPRISQGKVRYVWCFPTSARVPIVHGDLQLWGMGEWHGNCAIYTTAVPESHFIPTPLHCLWLMLIPELDRDLFSLPDGENPTLLFVTSGTPPT